MKAPEESPSIIKTNELKKKSSSHNFNKITHLYLHDKYLKIIPKLCQHANLTVLYLHNNEIFEIDNVEKVFPKISSLYLQNNFIQKIRNLDLKNLKKLYLGRNSITVVEGLENLEQLEELHLEKQVLNLGSCLCFDPRSIIKISETLQILNVSNNKIPSILCLSPLRSLVDFNASNNEIEDLEEVCTVISNWFYLKNLALFGNPIAKNRIYKESLISNAYCIEVFDQKDVTSMTRNFLKRLHREKVSKNLRKSVNIADKIENVSKNYPISIQKAVSASILKQKSRDFEDLAIFNEENAIYIPWRALPQPPPVTKVPLFRKNRRRVKEEKVKFMENQFQNLKI